MKEQFHDLSFEQLPDGTIRMEQGDYAGESYTIDAHPAQIIHMARVLVGARVSAEAERIKTLERRLRWMQDRFLDCYAALPGDFMERVADAPEFYKWLEASVAVAEEYCADLTPVEVTSPKADNTGG